MKHEIEKLVQKLVQIDTTESSLGAISVVNEFLDKYGIKSKVIDYADDQANLVASIGKGNETVLMSGHLDVVPVGDPAKWAFPPFSGKIDGNYLLGRGSVDMKGGTAAIIGALIELLNYEGEFTKKITLGITSQEEIGLIGASNLIKSMDFSKTTHILISEPTDLQSMIMEKGILLFAIDAYGKQSHASRPDLGVNAIEGIAELFPGIHACIPDNEDPILKKSTLNIAMINGGTAANVVPEHARLVCDSRLIPGVDIDKVYECIQQLLDNARNDVKLKLSMLTKMQAVRTKTDRFPNLVKDLTAKFGGPDLPLGGVPYATDGAVFMKAANFNADFVIFGPGSTKLLHQTNEKLDLTQLDISRNVIRESIRKVATY